MWLTILYKHGDPLYGRSSIISLLLTYSTACSLPVYNSEREVLTKALAIHNYSLQGELRVSINKLVSTILGEVLYRQAEIWVRNTYGKVVWWKKEVPKMFI